MTTNDDTFGRDLARWLREEGEHRVPDHLTEVLVRTVATRQRPWWSSPERWLPMDTLAPDRGLNLRPLAVLLVIGALLAAALGAAYVASRPKDLPAPALAENGRIFVIAGSEVRSYAPDGGDPQPYLALSGEASGLTVSRSGRLAFREGPDPGRIRVFPYRGAEAGPVRLPDGMTVGDQISWSPDGQTIVVPTAQAGKEYLYTWDWTTGASRLGGDAIDPTMGLWWPTYSPDGRWIAFVGIAGGAGKDPAPGDLYVIRPDGSGLRKVAEGVETAGAGRLGWSPEPGASKLLFVRHGVEILDLAASTTTALGLGSWATWSPDGGRVAAWQDGLVVVDPNDVPITPDEMIRPHPSFQGRCQDHPELAGKAICSIATWSPDGTRLIGQDIAGGGLLSLPADGTGAPVLLPSTAGTEAVAWRALR